jgi:transcriptional regulator with XRE-family HTH domain
MESFGEAFRKARKAQKVTLRQISNYVGKSIGYLSDVEHDRKRPPKLDIVSRIEEVLAIRDQSLINLAAKLRQKIPDEVTQKFKMTPKLSEVLLRADEDLTDDEFEELMNKWVDAYEKIKERRKT